MYSVFQTKNSLSFIQESVRMMTNIPTKRINAISHANNFHCFIPTRWRQKPAGIDKKRNYITVILCVLQKSEIPTIVSHRTKPAHVQTCEKILEPACMNS